MRTGEDVAEADLPPATTEPGPVLLAVSAVVSAASAVMIVRGAWAIGTSTDDGHHIDRLVTYFRHGWYVVPEQIVDGVPGPGVSDQFVYAPISSLLQQAAVSASLRTGWQDVVTSPGAMSIRHLVVAVLALLGAVAVGGIVADASRSWRWGLVGTATALSIPLWLGYGMFNNKDVPVATGFTCVTWGLVLLASRRSRRRWLAGTGVLALGLVLAVGTRPGIWPALALSGLLALGLAALHQRPDVGRAAGRLVGAAMAAAVLAWAVLALAYPAAFAAPWEAFVGAARASAQYGEVWYGYLLTDGTGHGLPPPLGYIPAWAGNQLPLLVLVGAFVSVGAAVLAVGRLLAGEQPRTVVALVLCGAQAFAVPLYAVAERTTLYGGLRQLLFAVPALAALAALGIRSVLTTARARQHHRPWTAAATAGVCLGLVLPVVDGARLFPYQYVYFNEVATLQPLEGRWTLEYYNVSLRELVDDLDSSAPAYCGEAERTYVLGEYTPRLLPKSGFVAPCAELASASYYAADRLVAPPPGDLDVPGSTFWYVRSNRLGSQVPDNCSTVQSVTRPLRGQDLVLSYLARCTVPAAAAANVSGS